MLNGIDIYHGDAITLQELKQMVKQHDLYFSIIKSSTGANGKDQSFAKKWKMSQDAGLICGAYHWLWPSTAAGLQVDNFMIQLKTVHTDASMPPVVDIEWTWNAADQQTEANELWRKLEAGQRIPLIKAFLDGISNKLSRTPIIYSSTTFWEERLYPQLTQDDCTYFASFPLWIADPGNRNKLPRPWVNGTALIKQTHFGESAGTTAALYDRMDQDVFLGDVKSFIQILAPGLAIAKNAVYSNWVKYFQQRLHQQNFLLDEPDGYFGTNTEKAVMAFQQANGLLENGIIELHTAYALADQ